MRVHYAAVESSGDGSAAVPRIECVGRSTFWTGRCFAPAGEPDEAGDDQDDYSKQEQGYTDARELEASKALHYLASD